jgi:hypothetical protein
LSIEVPGKVGALSEEVHNMADEAVPGNVEGERFKSRRAGSTSRESLP